MSLWTKSIGLSTLDYIAMDKTVLLKLYSI